jgi:MFS family permease
VKRAEKQSQIRTLKVDSSGQSGVLVLLGVLFTIILAGLDNTIVGTVMPVALPELGSAHLYAWTFAAYMLAAAVLASSLRSPMEYCFPSLSPPGKW